MNFLYIFLVAVPIAILAEVFHWSSTVILISSCIALVPLAGIMGEATEALAEHTGPKIGAFLNATLGNAAELIITIVALQAGKYTLLKASISGSILGNLLLVLGASLLLGGLKNGQMKYNRTLAGVNSCMLLLAVAGLIVPSMLSMAHTTSGAGPDLVGASVCVSIFLILIYILGMLFTFSKGSNEVEELQASVAFAGPGVLKGNIPHEAGEPAPAKHEDEEHHELWSVKKSVVILAIATGLIVVMSEFLVGAVEPVVQKWGISEFFIGIILVPIVGNVAEHIVGVQVALKNQMDLSLGIALGSSTQIALFVAPVLILLSLFVGPQAMDLHFSALEVGSLTMAVVVANFISLDGESNWLEGAMLLGLYLILGVGFYFYR